LRCDQPPNHIVASARRERDYQADRTVRIVIRNSGWQECREQRGSHHQ